MVFWNSADSVRVASLTNLKVSIFKWFYSLMGKITKRGCCPKGGVKYKEGDRTPLPIMGLETFKLKLAGKMF